MGCGYGLPGLDIRPDDSICVGLGSTVTRGASPVCPAALCRARLTDPPGDRVKPRLSESIRDSYTVKSRE